MFKSEMVVQLMDHMGDDYSPIQAARVSTEGADSRNTLDNNGLRRYLLREKHMVPFETQAMRFYIEAPIFVTRQLLKHRISSISEESGRYKELEPVFYVPSPNRPVVQVGKTGDYNFEHDRSLSSVAINTIKLASRVAWEHYTDLLADGVAKEVARMVLPTNIYSSMYMTMNTHSLMNLFELRTPHWGSKPQYEIAQVAERMYEEWANKYPQTELAYRQVS